MSQPSVTIVVPTLGRPSLIGLLDSLAASAGPRPERVVLVDDRPRPDSALLAGLPPGWLAGRITTITAGGRGPATARNAGWRAATTDWVAFLDDDVVVDPDWLTALARDLAEASPDLGGSQGQVRVPAPSGRRPTDWERGTAGLATARWITADMSYRRSALIRCGGFDERFPRAFREDADLALRVRDAGYTLDVGRRRITHPVRPARWAASIGQQRGNADDALMRRLHGPQWAQRAEAPTGRRPRHLAITAAALTALGAAVTGRPRLALAASAAWLAGTAEFAAARIVPGPRTPDELARMTVTSVVIPPAAVWHWLRGTVRFRVAEPWPAGPAGAVPAEIKALLVDRDGTIVIDVPYNGDPDQVRPMPGAREALDRARAAGLPVAVVSNQSGIGRGLLTAEQVDAVNARVEELLGPFAYWAICPHREEDGCACRKPRPDLVRRAAAQLGVVPQDCVLVGDIGADLGAARAAGAFGILVPTAQTRPDEVSAAEGSATAVVRPDLGAAVGFVLSRVATAPLAETTA